ncbi:MAG: DUF4173 domain-containing protein [Eubacterium sp.]|nr:DUF4173 domain-containing protein [Eubacterium sp.]
MDSNMNQQNYQSAMNSQPALSNQAGVSCQRTVPPYQPYVIQPKEYKKLDIKDKAFMLIFFVLSFIFINFAFSAFNLGFTIFYFLLFIASTVYLYRAVAKSSVFSLICGGLSLAGSVVFSIYDDGFINFILLILIGGLFTIYCLGLSNAFHNKQGSFKLINDVISGSLLYPIKNLPDMFGSIKVSAKSDKKSFNAVIGIVVALPVLLIIIPLLVKSDAAFEGLIDTVINNIGKYILQVIFAFIIAPYLISFMLGKRQGINKRTGKGKSTGRKSIPASGVISFLSVISATYIVYLFSQLAYFFSTFNGILPDDYEYSASAFARRGFFEMFAICVINILIISIVTILAKRNDSKRLSLVIKALSCFISLFSVLLIITAMSKMRLNIFIFGLSKNRLLVSVFMLMLVVIIAFFIVHIFVPRLNYMQPIIIICSAMFITLAFADVDGAVAKYNVSNQNELESVDVSYLGNLADSAIPYILELADDENLSNQVNYVMRSKMIYSDSISCNDDGQYVYDKPDFRMYNYSNDKAYKQLCAYLNSDSFKQYEQSYHTFDGDEYYGDMTDYDTEYHDDNNYDDYDYVNPDYIDYSQYNYNDDEFYIDPEMATMAD